MMSVGRRRRMVHRAGALAACLALMWQMGAQAQEAPPGGTGGGPTTTLPEDGGADPGTALAPIEEDTSKPRLDVRLGGLATGVRLFFSRPNTAPFDPLLPVSLAVASSIIDDGTSETRGFASAAYPGDVVAGVGGIVGLLGFPVGGQLLPADHPISQFYKSLPGFLPPWPFAVRGSFPGDPGRRVDVLSDVTRGVIPLPIPVVLQGAVQETNVTQGFVTAQTYLGRLQLANPAGALGVSPVLDQAAEFLKPFVGDVDVVSGDLIQLDGIRSRVEASDSGTKATSDAETTVSSIRLLGGLLELVGIRSGVSESSEGSGTTVTRHGVTVDTVRLLGTSVRLTDKGVEIQDQRIPTGALATAQELLNRAFTSMQQGGLSVSLPSATAVGPTRATQTLEIRLYGQNPTIPFVASPSTATITLAIGEASSRLEAELIPPLPAGEMVGGEATGALDQVAAGTGPGGAPVPALTGASSSQDGLDLGAPPEASTPAAAAEGASPPGTPRAAPLDPLRAISDEIGGLVRRMAMLAGFAVLLAGALWRRRFGFR